MVHLAGTCWFMLCTGIVFIMAMWQAGFNWLIIFSLSGYLALAITLLVSLYLFSIFRGASEGLTMQTEHPLTSTMYYMAFYVSTPFLGAIAGVLGMLGEKTIGPLMGGIATGTIGATFLTWIVVDTIAGSVELLTPQARRHRTQRMARARLIKQFEQTQRELLLARLKKQKSEKNLLWEQSLALEAGELAGLLTCDDASFSSARQQAIGLGVLAWQTGGLNCMKKLRDMAAEIFRREYNTRQFADYISVWWDGIGNWRNPSPA